MNRLVESILTDSDLSQVSAKRQLAVLISLVTLDQSASSEQVGLLPYLYRI